MFVFGILGYLVRKLDIAVAPMVLLLCPPRSRRTACAEASFSPTFG